MIVNQILYGTQKITTKIVSIALTSMGRGSYLKLDILDKVQNIATTGKVYRWDDHLTDIIKNICVNFQEEGSQILFPSLII